MSSYLLAHLLYVVVVYTFSSTDINMYLRCFRLGFRLVVCIIRLYDFTLPSSCLRIIWDGSTCVPYLFSSCANNLLPFQCKYSLARCHYILGSICTITTSEELWLCIFLIMPLMCSVTSLRSVLPVYITDNRIQYS